MKFLLSCLSLSLTLLSCSKPCDAAATSIHGGEKETTELTVGNIGEYQRNSTHFLSEGRRRLLPMEGVFRTLIIRVSDSAGNVPQTSALTNTDVWFGTHDLEFTQNQNSLTSLYDNCSGGKISFVPATGRNVNDGVFEYTIDQDLTGMGLNDCGNLIVKKFRDLKVDLGLEYDAYSIICPKNVGKSGGIAGIKGNYQFYSGGSDKNTDVVMHEVGHNIGFHHSGTPSGGDYGDKSCMMGCCAGAQVMCFNAAKSWYTGWYTEAGKEGHEDLNHFDTPGQWWKGKLVGIDDYLNEIFDENEHRVIARTPGLFTMFNRAKGVNAGVKGYHNQVVVVQQSRRDGMSHVVATLDEDTSSFTYSSKSHDFDVIVKVCEIVYSPDFTGPQIIGGTASQSSTSFGNVASRAIDGNLDANWSGNSITYNAGVDPWWKLVMDSEEAVGHIRVTNRGDWGGFRLNNAFIELFDGSGALVFSENMGAAQYVRDLFLGDVYNVKMVRIRLQGNKKILSLAEVQLFAPPKDPQARQPDYAEVITYVTDRSNPIHLTCGHTMAPTLSSLPSLYPTTSAQPTHYVAIPKGVILARADSLCLFQHNPSNHPDRFKCLLQPTTRSDKPGGHGNDDVALQGEDGCVIIVQPVAWAYRGNSFIFESTEELDTINACFAANTRIIEHRASSSPTSTPTPVPTQNQSEAPTDAPSDTQTNFPTGNPTASPTAAPSPSPTILTRQMCLKNNKVWHKGAKKTNNLERKECFEECPKNPTSAKKKCKKECQKVWKVEKSAINSENKVNKKECKKLPKEQPVIPRDVILARADSSCVFQHNPSNHPDRFKCLLQPTTRSDKPGGHGNDDVALQGEDGCVIIVQPVTWAYRGNLFIFESTEELDTINACFAANTRIIEH